MERPIFSISTSFYNRGRLVDKAYEMICEQTYPYWEWVVTDDFSEHDSAEQRLKEIAAKDSRVKYYTQSRKKEVFYNPNYGCGGNIVMQLDCDDYVFPKLLEIYAKHFSEDPELMGICCGFTQVLGESHFLASSTIVLEDKNCIDWMPHGRAWRNIIPHFDLNGELNHYQNDTNIMRHVEARGKVLFLQRELYTYYHSDDSISRAPTPKDIVEEERLRIEGKFPIMNNTERCTFDLKYVPIEALSWAFYNSEFNRAKDSRDILFIKTDIKPFEKQLLSELFWDHSIDYNVGKREKYDEIIMFLDEETYEYVKENFSLLVEKYPDSDFRFFHDSKIFEIEKDEMIKLFKSYAWKNTQSLTWGWVRF